MATLQLDQDLLSNVKLFCDVNKIKMGDFVKYLCDNSKEFKDFQRKVKKIKL